MACASLCTPGWISSAFKLAITHQRLCASVKLKLDLDKTCKTPAVRPSGSRISTQLSTQCGKVQKYSAAMRGKDLVLEHEFFFNGSGGISSRFGWSWCEFTVAAKRPVRLILYLFSPFSCPGSSSDPHRFLPLSNKHLWLSWALLLDAIKNLNQRHQKHRAAAVKERKDLHTSGGACTEDMSDEPFQ